MSLTTRDDSLVAGRGIEPVKVFDSGGRRNTVVVKALVRCRLREGNRCRRVL